MGDAGTEPYGQPYGQRYGRSEGGPAGGTAEPVPHGLAGFWIRFLGALIDGLVVGVAVALVTAPFGGVGLTADPGEGLTTAVNLDQAVQTLLAGVYFTYLHATAAGQTLGQRVVGIRLADARTGGPIPWSRALVRYVVSLVSGLVLLLGYLWMLFNRRNQTWHDIAASTVVVKTSVYPAPGPFGRLPG